MVTPPGRPPLSAEQRRVLEMLNRAPRSGCTNTLLIAHGFALPMLIGLINDGLAEVATEIVTAPGGKTEIVRFRITAAGRKAIRG
jgi:hypothetical protein